MSIRIVTKAQSRIATSLLFFSSFGITLIVMEFGYRIYLLQRTLITFNATNKPLYDYSASVGYNYIANMEAVGIYMRNGKVFTYDSISVGPYGNLGNGVQSWTDEDFKILAFGDSFTANPYKYFSWTDYVAAPLSSATGRNVEVMNLGRDGYGVLQMVRLASTTLKQTTADLVVIAFIVDDLDRARVWRSKLEVNGRVRTLLSVEPGPVTSATVSQTRISDVVLTYPDITTEWCEAQVGGGKPNDPILAGLTSYCQSLVPENFTHPLTSLTRSFLLRRIRYGDPFEGFRKLPRMPRIDFQDFRQDEEFVEDVRSLLKQPVPVLMIMLPWYPELQQGAFILTEQRTSLLESFQHLTGETIVSAFDYLDRPMDNLEQMFFVPDDYHPRQLGAERYGKVIAKAILARLNAGSRPKRAYPHAATSRGRGSADQGKQLRADM